MISFVNTKTDRKFFDSEVIRAIDCTWVFLQKEKFSFLNVFSKVFGHPEVIERQFGSVMLDLMFAGREIKTNIPLTNVEKILEEYLPHPVTEIESMLKQEISKIEYQLLAFHNQIRPVLEITEAPTEDKVYLADEDAFLYFDDSTILLTDEQELTLKAIAYSIT